MMTATKTHREMCQEDWIISGGWRVFRIRSTEWHHFRTEVGTAFGKICWVNWRIVSCWKIYFQREYVIQPCCLDIEWILEMCSVHSWLCCKTCFELWAFNRTPLWIINTLMFLSASLLCLANLSIQQHLNFFTLLYMNNDSSLNIIRIMFCRNLNSD